MYTQMWQNNISRINANEFQGIVQTSIQLNLSEYISKREREALQQKIHNKHTLEGILA